MKLNDKILNEKQIEKFQKLRKNTKNLIFRPFDWF